MNEMDYLASRETAVTRRLGRRSRSLNRYVDGVVAPWVREHPMTGLAVGAATGLLIGAAAAPAVRAASGRGLVRGPLEFFKGTAAFAVRTRLMEALEQEDGEET